jgi:hypothetical protein
MKLAWVLVPLAAVASLTIVSPAHAGQESESGVRADRAAAYAVPVALLASAHALAVEGHEDLANTFWLGGISTLSLPVWSAQNEGSAAWGLAALVVGSGTEFVGDLCSGNCRTAVRAAGLLGYASIAATDIAWYAYREPSDVDVSRAAPGLSRWYGWRPLVGYGSLLGGIWLGTVDSAGAAGGGLTLAAMGLDLVPVSHFSVGRRTQGWVALGGTALGAGLGTLAACANGCSSPYDRQSRAVFAPGRALLGATAGIATWALVDVALLSCREEPAAPRRTMSVEPFITTSPTTGRPRAGASFAF